MILTDTNILSEIRKGRHCAAAVAEGYAGVAEGELYLSVLVLVEIRKGAELARRRRDYAQAEALENWLQTVAERFFQSAFCRSTPLLPLLGVGWLPYVPCR